MPTPSDMPTQKARPLSTTEERRLRSRTANRLILLHRQHLPKLDADEMLSLHEALDVFYGGLHRRIGERRGD